MIRLLLLCLLVTPTVSTFAQTTPQFGIRDKTPHLSAFTNARIVISPTKSLDSATLIIKDGRVVSVTQGLAVPPDAKVIDLDGKTIYPGFIDPYTDYGLPKTEKSKWQRGQRPVYKGKRIGANAWNDAIHAEVDWVNEFKPDSSEAEKFLKSGFAVVQSARMDGIFRGRSFVTTLGRGLPNDLVLLPRSTHFVSFDKGSSTQQYPNSLMGSIALIRQTLYDTDWYQKAHTAYLADHTQEMPEFNSAIEALAEYRESPFVFETKDKLSLLRADRVAREFNRAFTHVGSGDEYTHLAHVKATGATLILPLDFPPKPEVTTLEDELDVTIGELRHWNTAPANPALLADEGVTFAFTTHRLKKKADFLTNLRKAVKRGLDRQTALAALTTVPAQLCGIAELAGTLEEGRLANLVITDGDIFEDSTKLYATWVAGEEHEFIDLEQVDFRGDYNLTTDELRLQLSLSGKLSKPSATVSRDSIEISLEHLTFEKDKLHFSLPLDSLGSSGVARFTGRKKDNRLLGLVKLPNGDKADWIADLISPKLTDSEEATTDTDTSDAVPESEPPDPILTRLTYPNIGYGFEELPGPENVLIHNATVWTSDSQGILESADVLVIDGKFTAIGSDLSVPENTRVIDATGKHVTAGIIDEHSHLAISGGVNEGTHATTSEVRIGDVVNSDDVNIYRQLSGGVTTSQLLHGSANPIGGQAQIIKLRWGHTPEGLKFRGAPPTIKFALGENVKQSNWGDNFKIRYPQTRMGVHTSIKDAFQAAREYETDWEQYRSLSRRQRERTIPPRKDLQLDALVSVLNSEMFIHCHSYHQTEILMLMRLAEEYGFTIQTFTHILEGYKVADEMAAHGATASSFSDWWAYKFEVYDAIAYSPCLMAERGVVTSVNSDDAELARRLNQEAAKSVMYCDMPEEEALKMVTINPAIQLKIDDRVGSITVGKDADFVIWNTNPLSVYAGVEQTWIEGRKFFDKESDLKQRQLIKQERAALIQGVLDDKSNNSASGGKKRKEHGEWHCDDIFDYWNTADEGKQ
jgi:imidazolonepropionase-like amidohydrolase